MTFFSRLSYSAGNEDWKTEEEALQVGPDDHILSVTASGDRPLNLLRMPCASLTTVDANPLQSALFDLKCAAIQTLSFEDYLAFLGADQTTKQRRLDLYAQVQEALAPDSRAVWGKHRAKVARGVLYEGTIEKLTTVASAAIKGVRGKKVEKLFSFANMEEQRAFVEEEWNSRAWKALFDISLHPFFTRLFIKDPGLYEYVDSSVKVSEHIYNRITYALQNFPARESILASLVFNGRLFEEGYPPYLREEGLKTIRPQLDKTAFHTTNIIDYLENAPEASFDCFSISDIASYMDKPSFDRLCRGISRAAKPGARFCIRQFTSRHTLPEDLNFHRNHSLEDHLSNQDRCFIYKFMVGTIDK